MKKITLTAIAFTIFFGVQLITPNQSEAGTTCETNYLGYSISEGEITGKWKVEDNKLCYKWKKTKTREEETEFQCTVNIYSNNKKTFYFFDILNKVFYAKGYRVQ